MAVENLSILMELIGTMMMLVNGFDKASCIRFMKFLLIRGG
jgi:hypothetical protein